MSRFCFVGEPPRRQERSLLSLPQSTASVVGVCRSHRWMIARISEVQAAPRTNGREPALQGACEGRQGTACAACQRKPKSAPKNHRHRFVCARKLSGQYLWDTPSGSTGWNECGHEPWSLPDGQDASSAVKLRIGLTTLKINRVYILVYILKWRD